MTHCNLMGQSQDPIDFQGSRLSFGWLWNVLPCICMEWTAAKYRGQNSELTAREALSQFINLKSFRGVPYRALGSPTCTDRQCAWPGRGVECTILTNSPRRSLNTLPCPCYYPFFTSNCSVMVIVRSAPWRNYLLTADLRKEYSTPPWSDFWLFFLHY